ncbi:MAG: hypothetical protein QF475_00140, partial [Candidatus Undinarchaeales archaeon]|nr:hypothetical protein [Candidatus Undinarchaeales archaeon]
GFEVVVDIVDLGQQEALVKGRVLNARQIEVLIETGEDPFLYPVSPFTLDAGKQYFVKIVARRGKYTKRKLRLLKKSSKLKKLLKEY